MRRQFVVTAALAAVLLGALAPLRQAHADTINIAASKDATLYENEPTFGNGAGDYLFAGRNASAAIRRALIAFDVGSIPPGSSINAVSLTLRISRGREDEAPPGHPVALHRVLAPWTEGATDATGEEGSGAVAVAGDVTWSHRVFATTPWTAAGGDFLGASSVSGFAGVAGEDLVLSGAGMLADVQAWVNTPASNQGWALVSGAVEASHSRRYNSRTHPDADTRPRLFVDFTPATPIGACCAVDGSCSTVPVPGNACVGAYRGDGTDCGTVACPQPAGACCFADAQGTCSEVTQEACTAEGGTFRGDFVACAEDLCPVLPTAFLDPLPIPPAAVPSETPAGEPPVYEMSIVEFEQQLHSELPPTRVWGFDDGTNGPSTPGPSFDVRSGDPIEVVWRNELRDENGDLRTEHILPVDMCMMGAMEPDPRTVIHFHGGHVAADSDGNPEETQLPGEEVTYQYPNAQRASTLWYHDHALGITRLNVYMGMAGAYLLRDDEEDALGLPSGANEIPLVLQDRSFLPDGQLRYPEMWMEHHFGDVAMVNGRVWPYLQVPRGKVRFRLVNGSGSRTWRLALSNGAPFVQIGSDGGLLAAPVTRQQVLVQPGERADLVVDFEPYAPGTQIVLQNDAPTPFPNGGMMHELPQVMRFDVVDAPGHTAPIPASLSAIPPIDEAEADITRDLVLRKEVDDCTGEKWQINGLSMDDVTEMPTLGTSEIWQFFNDSGVAHPMHLHLVMFRVLDRQPYALVDGEHVPTGPVVLPPPEEQGWKDTVRVDPFTKVRVIAKFEDYTGMFAYHCHILEHEDHDMMRMFMTMTECGDGALGMPDEECDDGNRESGDGCSASCTVEAPPGTGGGGGGQGGTGGEGAGAGPGTGGATTTSGGGDGGGTTSGGGDGGAPANGGGAPTGPSTTTTSSSGGDGGSGDDAAEGSDGSCYCEAAGGPAAPARGAPAAMVAAAAVGLAATRRRRARVSG